MSATKHLSRANISKNKHIQPTKLVRTIAKMTKSFLSGPSHSQA